MKQMKMWSVSSFLQSQHSANRSSQIHNLQILRLLKNWNSCSTNSPLHCSDILEVRMHTLSASSWYYEAAIILVGYVIRGIDRKICGLGRTEYRRNGNNLTTILFLKQRDIFAACFYVVIETSRYVESLKQLLDDLWRKWNITIVTYIHTYTLFHLEFTE